MLVFTRHLSQSFCIGDEIEITVIDVCKDQVRLGIGDGVQVEVTGFGLGADQQVCLNIVGPNQTNGQASDGEGASPDAPPMPAPRPHTALRRIAR